MLYGGMWKPQTYNLLYGVDSSNLMLLSGLHTLRVIYLTNSITGSILECKVFTRRANLGM